MNKNRYKNRSSDAAYVQRVLTFMQQKMQKMENPDKRKTNESNILDRNPNVFICANH